MNLNMMDVKKRLRYILELDQTNVFWVKNQTNVTVNMNHDGIWYNLINLNGPAGLPVLS